MEETLLKQEKIPLSAKINFWFYWNFKRRAGTFGRWLTWKLPRRVIYWCVVRAAVEVDHEGNPENVTASEMLTKFNYH